MIAALALSLVTSHLMPARQGTLNVIDTGVFVAVSLPVAAFETSERDAELKRRFRVLDGAHEGRLEFLQFDAPHGDELVALMKVSFEAPPTALRVETDLVRDELKLKFLRGAQVETVVLQQERTMAPWLIGAALVAGCVAFLRHRQSSARSQHRPSTHLQETHSLSA